ncbi:MAG: hypothetical protein L0154_09315 [Chloroflexi bacterium]|nr:hypothetical protein [Chloroflexota bacterium]
MIFRLVIFLALFISITIPSIAQSTPVISADNIHLLQSASTIDFDALPDDIQPASGQFVINHDATVVVSFGNVPGEPPFSRAIRWHEGEMVINQLDDSSLVRYLTDDGKCLYVGYVGYMMIYAFHPEQEAADVWLGALELPSAQDSAVNFWMQDDTTCNADFYVEVAAEDGTLKTLHVVDGELETLHEDIFALPDGTVAARVGRIPPPLALTLDFDGNLYRWDMTSNEITASLNVDDVAMFGKLNNSGTHYVWLPNARDGLYVADFTDGTYRQVVSFDELYISHLILADNADVVIGVDPYDNRGTVVAWKMDDAERLELGEYRHCERVQPDLARLSSDGTALVIGCDTGIDIWRVLADNGSGRNY